MCTSQLAHNGLNVDGLFSSIHDRVINVVDDANNMRYLPYTMGFVASDIYNLSAYTRKSPLPLSTIMNLSRQFDNYVSASDHTKKSLVRFDYDLSIAVGWILMITDKTIKDLDLIFEGDMQTDPTDIFRCIAHVGTSDSFVKAKSQRLFQQYVESIQSILNELVLEGERLRREFEELVIALKKMKVFTATDKVRLPNTSDEIRGVPLFWKIFRIWKTVDIQYTTSEPFERLERIVPAIEMGCDKIQAMLTTLKSCFEDIRELDRQMMSLEVDKIPIRAYLQEMKVGGKNLRRVKYEWTSTIKEEMMYMFEKKREGVEWSPKQIAEPKRRDV